MNEKYVNWLQGAAGGAAALAIVGFTWGGWHTEKGTAERAQTAVRIALIPECVRDVMADTASAEELKAKRASDYDDVVRDYRKRKGNLADHGYQFNRDCGKAIEAALTKTAPKS
jgi:alpha/beta superfamily hydrolase